MLDTERCSIPATSDDVGEHFLVQTCCRTFDYAETKMVITALLFMLISQSTPAPCGASIDVTMTFETGATIKTDAIRLQKGRRKTEEESTRKLRCTTQGNE